MSLTLLELSKEQQSIFDTITVEKKNVFFTGCAGTGKSNLIKVLIKYFTDNLELGELATTASTGTAAFNIGGTTLHSFAGIGLGLGTIDEIVNKNMYNKKLRARWNSTKVLIIDEISMLKADYFEKVEKFSKVIRNSSRPFGGIQLILTGDLLQLPPINQTNSDNRRIFEAECWDKCIDSHVVLYEIFRQSDTRFAEILTYIRLGLVNDEVVNFIKEHSTPKVYEPDCSPVNLYATRHKVDKYNKNMLEGIKEEVKVYKSIDKYKSKSTQTTLDSCPAVSLLELKIGAQVMLIKNINKDLVNGTVGTVVSFTEHTSNIKDNHFDAQFRSLPIVMFSLTNGKLFTRVIGLELWSQTLPTGEEIASRKQVPLILAWAVTIHKSQGQTIQRLAVDLSDIFEPGQVYTALSRAVSPDTLEITGFDSSKVIADEKSLQFCANKGLL